MDRDEEAVKRMVREQHMIATAMLCFQSPFQQKKRKARELVYHALCLHLPLKCQGEKEENNRQEVGKDKDSRNKHCARHTPSL